LLADMDKQLNTQWKDEPVRVIQISAGDPDWWLVSYAEEYGLTMPIYYTDPQNESPVCIDYKIDQFSNEQFEAIYVLDQAGVVRYSDFIREEISLEKAYDQVDRLLAESEQ